MIRVIPLAGLLLLLSTLSRAQPLPAVPVPPPAAQAAAPDDALPRETLEALYKAELGGLYTRDVAPLLPKAHAAMEGYFAAKTADERKAFLAEIESTGIPTAVLGRVARIRTYWPQFAGGVYYVNERVGPHNVLYFLGVPKDYDRARPWPLVVKLPGAHAFVTDPSPDADAVVKLYSGWIRDELERHPDAVVLMPLLDLKELWGPSYKGMNNVVQPMHHVAGRVNIDPRRVYLVGHGMAAHAAWNLAIHYPTYFAAINPLAGGASAPWQRLRMANLRNVLAVAWHDADDLVVKAESSRGVAKLLQILKYDVDYEETRNVGHAPTDEIAERTYLKTRARSRDLYPAEVVVSSNRPDTLFNRADWLQIYQPLTPGDESKQYLRHGTGTITFNQHPHAATATITAPNRIEIRSTNVESLRVYLNDQMADLSKPVTVVVNRRTRFEGVVTPSTEEMLKDQTFLGRGWRYYTAFIDIDFGKPQTPPTTGPATRKGIITVIPDGRTR